MRHVPRMSGSYLVQDLFENLIEKDRDRDRDREKEEG